MRTWLSSDSPNSIDGRLTRTPGDLKPVSTVFAGRFALERHGCMFNHSQNVYVLVRAAVRGGPCRAFTEAVRVHATASDDMYPDLSVTCDPRDLADLRRGAIAFPTLIGKFDLYRQISTLREYVLIDSIHGRWAEARRRDGAGIWASTVYGSADSVRIDTVDLAVPMAAIYEDSDL